MKTYIDGLRALFPQLSSLCCFTARSVYTSSRQLDPGKRLLSIGRNRCFDWRLAYSCAVCMFRDLPYGHSFSRFSWRSHEKLRTCPTRLLWLPRDTTVGYILAHSSLSSVISWKLFEILVYENRHPAIPPTPLYRQFWPTSSPKVFDITGLNCRPM